MRLVYPDLEALSAACAGVVAARLRAAVQVRGRAVVALAGGGTPRSLYEHLAARADVPWLSLHLCWGDERFVSPGSPESNARLVHETLLARAPVPPAQVHPMPTQGAGSPEEAARAYEATLRALFPGAAWPRFDLVLLGIGADGHTASLFPGAAALAERARWVVPAAAPAAPRQRLTLTLAVLNHAAAVFFLAAGAGKAAAVRAATAARPEARRCPASAVRPAAGACLWWLDAAAAG